MMDSYVSKIKGRAWILLTLIKRAGSFFQLLVFDTILCKVKLRPPINSTFHNTKRTTHHFPICSRKNLIVAVSHYKKLLPTFKFYSQDRLLRDLQYPIMTLFEFIKTIKKAAFTEITFFFAPSSPVFFSFPGY